MVSRSDGGRHMPELTDLDKRIGLLGLICMHWSYLEYLLAVSIWQFLKIRPDVGIVVTGGLSIQPRANMALNLAKKAEAPADFISTLESTKNSIEIVSGERNLAVHGVYGLDPKDDRVFAEVHRGKFRGSEQDMPLGRIEQTVRDINEIIENLTTILEKYDFIDDIPPDVKASLEKSP